MSAHRNELVGIYLAAGQSSRMGADKLALPFGRLPLGAAALEKAIASRLGRIFIVVKQDSVAWVDESLRLLPGAEKCSCVTCPDAAEGMSRSIIAGVRAALAAGARGAMIVLADQPLITAELLNALIRAFDNAVGDNPDVRYAASALGSSPRPPVLFAREAFPELLALQGDCGAKELLKRMEGVAVECRDPALFYDIDCKDQYAGLLGQAHHAPAASLSE